MNTSTYPTRLVHKIIRRVVFHEKAITDNICGSDPDMCEIPRSNSTWENDCRAEGDFIEILSIDETNGLVDIEYAIDYDESYEEAGDAWRFRYRTLIEAIYLKEELEK